jgi:glycosyltransferase involved in cell wall biosynthesis
MQKKKILHLISGLEIGGTETQLSRILPKLKQYHENRVCCVRGHGPIGIKLEKNGVKVYYLELKNAFDILAIKRFYKIVKDFSPNILVTYLIHADLYGRFLGRLFGIKKIVSSKRGSLLQWEWLSFFDRLTKKMVTHYLVQTKTAKKEWVRKIKFPENKFTIIPNGIETEKFQIQITKERKKEELGIPKNSLTISCISRLRQGKGHEILLKAFEDVFETNGNISLLIVGSGEKEEDLKKQIEYYKSKNNIFFLGNRNDVPKILAVSDLFVLPTEKEGMSNAIMEAMSAGVPIITTNISENEDLIINKKTGLLFPVNNSDSLAENIKLLIKNFDLRKELGQNAKQKAAKDFDIEKVTLTLADFYSKV